MNRLMDELESEARSLPDGSGTQAGVRWAKRVLSDRFEWSPLDPGTPEPDVDGVFVLTSHGFRRYAERQGTRWFFQGSISRSMTWGQLLSQPEAEWFYPVELPADPDEES